MKKRVYSGRTCAQTRQERLAWRSRCETLVDCPRVMPPFRLLHSVPRARAQWFIALLSARVARCEAIQAPVRRLVGRVLTRLTHVPLPPS